VTSAQKTRDRVVGVWGPRAFAWSGEERQRAAGFPIDPSGRQRVLGFPADSFTPVRRDWRRKLAHPVRCYKRRGLGLSASNEDEPLPGA
jgi:hypothetical protein